MVNVRNKNCIHPECKKQPNYNKEGEKTALYCSLHKLEGMINVVSKICIHPGCKIIPTYNKEGETNALYCSSHKLENMVNVIKKTCIHPKCKIIPTYNKEGEIKALFCLFHKLENMVNVISKTCIHTDCKKQRVFNKEGETNPLYCSLHKLEGMVNVKHKTCIYPDCKIRPIFNIKGEIKPLYCFKHKLKDMYNVITKPCIQSGCKIQPVYNKEGEKTPLYCSSHKLEGMVNIKSKTCKTHLCSTRAGDKYDGYCLFCYMNMFPDKPVSRNYKTKEYAVLEYVKTKYPNLTWVSDKIIQNGCSKRRPDLLLDLGYQIIIVEIDENQHIDYDCSCENKRIMELSQDLGHRPIVFIRFNPDNYMNKENIVTSCWGQNAKGICVVKKNKKNEWMERLNALSLQIDYWIEPSNKTNKTIEIIQLFYDS
jgi:hypothetical protein